MRRPMWVWAIVAFLLVVGGTWLAALVWKTSAYGAHVIGAALAGLTLARAIPGRTAMLVAVIGVLGWLAFQIAIFAARDSQPYWLAHVSTSPLAHFALLALITSAAAAAGASLRLRASTRDPYERAHVMWLSSLLLLGTIVTLMMIATNDRYLPGVTVLGLLAAPMVAGALAQYLAPYLMIWTAGGGAAILVLLILDRASRSDSFGDVLAAVLGAGVFWLLGALGARIAWRVFRNDDAKSPSPVGDVPTAKVYGGDV